VDDGDFALDSAYRFTQGSTVVTVGAPTAAYADTAELAATLNANTSFAQNFTASSFALYDNTDPLNPVTTHNLVVQSKNPGAGDITIDHDDAGGGDFTTAAGIGTNDAVEAGFDSAAAAQASINLIDTQITNISTARAELGAVQNRFESAINSLNVSKENITAAESRIRDTDMASEMVNFTRANLLSQAGTAMLAQANQSNSGVLQLLG
jgi:flagellin